MECCARDLNYYFNAAWQVVDVRKARKKVMKSGIVQNTTYNSIIKIFCIFDNEKKK